ncbi:hypothetical protein V3H18_07720 [Methylocystis sp. 9N]|uniref:DUF883 family protein n=1 Tax=Methylocystis borbori TaxID=3118750 RepID=A0ABU7XGA5_9HYPH
MTSSTLEKSEKALSEATSLITEKTSAVAQKIGTAVDVAVEKAGEAVDAAKEKGADTKERADEVFSNIQDAIAKSAKGQPTMTVLLAVGVGFLLGALWKSGR